MTTRRSGRMDRPAYEKQGGYGLMTTSSTRLAAVAVAGLTTVAAAACGSSSHSSSGGASPSSAANAAASSSGGASAEVAAAQQVVAKWSQAPTSIGITVPLKSAPPAGKTLVWMQCALAQCTQIGQGIAAATKAVGWTDKVITYDSANPATLVAGMKTALQYSPVAVVNSGLPESVWDSVVPQYEAAHVPIVTMDAGPETLPSDVIANLYGSQDINSQGQIIANWFIADSNGQGKALLVDVPAFPVLHAFAQSFSSSVSQGCKACAVTTLSAPIAAVEAGQLNGLITSALRKDPSTKYLIVVDGAFIDTLPSSLSAAGLTGSVKIAGAWGDAVTETLTKQGTMDAFTGFATEYHGWQAVDAISRHLEGMSLPDSSEGSLPDQLLTKSTIQAPSDSYNYPANYPQQFESLWHVNG